ncbi:glycoside hydrolase family 3 C-terminal domain-containing protein [Mucilaginibacter jinjuensis]|uniref:Glycoside hydrolase family 3 C-terminal domain-containing protein n=1 Tax=Mucilaginibacter jinjuensis TaxID=1176721 RepID=A0ABY7T449_9SPHI|nr:glycoside hydrolase family 3 C-terminal domain-containing protein [Mucilaginibacter jinjuensis]WCT11064.1 glycoside hydrolase family 3 C-terminal domain-containing protein [Mucilaginibacter jinjuensis]
MPLQKLFKLTFTKACCLLLLAVGQVASAQYRYPFQNPELPVEDRITNLLSLLNTEEKINCLGTNPTVERLGIKGTGHVEGLHGLSMGVIGNWGGKTPVPTTIFPQSIGLAETWSPELLQQAAAIEAKETRYIFQSAKYHKGGLVVRAPNADLGRDPRWGRTEESYGEDAVFNATMVVSYIKGLQGNNSKYWETAALMKHFLANSNENSRDSSNSVFDDRLFNEYYGYTFHKGIVQGGSRAYMASYNKVNGIPQAVNPMLRRITIDQWGENGIICTDGGAYKLLFTAHHYAATPEEIAADCIKAGINQFLDTYKAGVKGALDKKLITEAEIDQNLRGVFRVMIKLGQLDPPEMNPYSSIKDGPEPWLSSEHRDFARLITQKSIVLLKNENNFLPLDKNKAGTVAIVGPRSAEVLQDWYSGTPPYSVSPLEGIKNKVSSQVNVIHTTDNAVAVSMAKSADVVIVCVGNNPSGNLGWKKVDGPTEGREAVDRESISLDSLQEDLIKKLHAVNPHIVMVLVSSFPYAINWEQENIPAILHITHCSQELGNALADVIYGDVNPGGRLVQTWPKSLDQLPPMMDYNIRYGRTYMYLKDTPLYPFGYGLSYTTFQYGNLQSTNKLNAKDSLTVSIDISNTGAHEGDEVVQLYVKYLKSKVERPIKELKAFKRITLKAGEKKTVQLKIAGADLAYWNTGKNKFVVENEPVELMVGSSSADIKETKVIEIKN